jgi:hypothetical protein
VKREETRGEKRGWTDDKRGEDNIREERKEEGISTREEILALL